MTCRLTWTRLLRRKRSPKAQDDLWKKTFSNTLKVINFYSLKSKFIRVGIVKTDIDSQYDIKKECLSSQTDGTQRAKCLVLPDAFRQWIESLSLSYLCQRVVLLIVDRLDHWQIISMANCSCPLDNGVGNDYKQVLLIKDAYSINVHSLESS